MGAAATTICTDPTLERAAALLQLLQVDGTGISWCDLTFNPWMGCTEHGPGCLNCYARDFARNRMGLNLWGPGVPRQVTKGPWRDVLRWNRLAKEAGVSLRVFCGSMMDVGDPEAPPEARARMFEIIRLCDWLDFLLVTKRPAELLGYLPTWWGSGPPNVWVIGSICTPSEVERDVERVAAIPAVVHGLSLEPLLSDVSVQLDAQLSRHRIDWLIVGGESGSIDKVRPFYPSWALGALSIAERHGATFWMKQLGTWWARRGYEGPLRLSRKADVPEEWPSELRVQQHPLERRVRS